MNERLRVHSQPGLSDFLTLSLRGAMTSLQRTGFVTHFLVLSGRSHLQRTDKVVRERAHPSVAGAAMPEWQRRGRQGEAERSQAESHAIGLSVPTLARVCHMAITGLGLGFPHL